ncbi:MAG: glycosyl transferase [Mucilaginibacter sp.]|nr:glycosyl transferase [Mucilaginibacter sp.]
MRILYLITGLRLGGAENQLLTLAHSMQLFGNKVLVVSMESGGVLANKLKEKNINVIELDIDGYRTLWSGYRKFKTVVKQFSPDIIHSHMIHANLFSRIFRLFNNGFKLICTAHNIREGNEMMMRGYWLTSAIPNWSTNVSKEAFEFFVKKKYFNAKKSSFIPNAIDTVFFNPDNFKVNLVRKQFNIPEEAYVFFSAGRLHEQKNYQMLLDAFEIVQRSIKQAVLIIAGEGLLYDKLKERSITLGIQDKTIFLGGRNDIPALMSMCDCFVLSSKFEGFGLVVGEAMAMQKPVVATDCGGVKEVMGGFGMLVAVDDTRGLADAMLKTHQSPYSVNHLYSARKHIEDNYAVPFVINQWSQLYYR